MTVRGQGRRKGTECLGVLYQQLVHCAVFTETLRRSRCMGWGGGEKSCILDSPPPPEPGSLSLKGTRSSEKSHTHSPSWE